MNKSKRIIILLKVICVLLSLAIAGLIYSYTFVEKPKSNVVDNVSENIDEDEIVVEKNELINFTHDDWDSNYLINNDYVGQLIFNSEIINEPIVKGATNNTYLRTDWQTKKYTVVGTCFMDSNNVLDDQNIVIYGHHADIGFTDYEGYEDGDRPMFSYLDLLLSRENYEENSVIYLYLKDKARVYKVTNVFYCPLSKDENGEYVFVKEGYEYYLSNYSNEEFNKYKSTLNKETIYDTGFSIDMNDKILTLQTCVSGRLDLREIIVCKYIESKDY